MAEVGSVCLWGEWAWAGLKLHPGTGESNGKGRKPLLPVEVHFRVVARPSCGYFRAHVEAGAHPASE